MPNLNLNYGLLIYEDQNEKNPQIKLPDISKCVEGVGVNFDKSDRITLYPNETKTIATTSRVLGWDNTTELQFLRYLSSGDNMRLIHTGTGSAPNFRTNRNLGGDATTTVTISRVTPYVARISVVGGTAWDTSNVQVNDYLKFERDTDAFTSPFSELNKGKTYLIQAKGASYVDFVDNGQVALDENIALGADFATAVLAMSQSPVKVGDLIEISGSGLRPSNTGKFEIVDVSPTYIEFVNSLGVDETQLYGTNSLVVYEYLIGFLHLRSSGPVKLRFGDQAEWAQLARLGNEGLFIGSVCTHSIEAFNDSPEAVVISVQHAMVL